MCPFCSTTTRARVWSKPFPPVQHPVWHYDNSGDQKCSKYSIHKPKLRSRFECSYYIDLTDRPKSLSDLRVKLNDYSRSCVLVYIFSFYCSLITTKLQSANVFHQFILKRSDSEFDLAIGWCVLRAKAPKLEDRLSYVSANLAGVRSNYTVAILSHQGVGSVFDQLMVKAPASGGGFLIGWIMLYHSLHIRRCLCWFRGF